MVEVFEGGKGDGRGGGGGGGQGSILGVYY